jgi:uncharacterized membrane protein
MTDKSRRRGPSGTQYVTARRRVAIAGLAGVFTYGVVALLTPWQVAVLLGWDGMAASFLVGIWLAIRGSDSGETERLAKTEDPSRALADLVLVSASVASLPGVGLALLKASSETGVAQAVITAVAVVTVALSWLSVQAVSPCDTRISTTRPTEGSISTTIELLTMATSHMSHSPSG